MTLKHCKKFKKMAAKKLHADKDLGVISGLISAMASATASTPELIVDSLTGILWTIKEADEVRGALGLDVPRVPEDIRIAVERIGILAHKFEKTGASTPISNRDLSDLIDISCKLFDYAHSISPPRLHTNVDIVSQLLRSFGAKATISRLMTVAESARRMLDARTKG